MQVFSLWNPMLSLLAHRQDRGALATRTRRRRSDRWSHSRVAYAVGPNYNFPWELQDPAGKTAALARAYDSARAALALVEVRRALSR
jgi:hypothetical protein